MHGFTDSSPWRAVLRRFAQSPVALAGLVLLIVILLLALFAPLLAPQNPYDLQHLDFMDSRLAPGADAASGALHYWLGTDDQGRDMLSAILYGLRISVAVGVVSTLIAAAIGLALGLLAGYAGGRLDNLIMRVVDMQLSFPPILVAIILLALTGRGVDKIIIALVAVQWAYYARTVRSVALVERRKEYMEAALLLGLSTPRKIFRHLLPNCLSPLIVVGALQVGTAITLEATLSFLGVGLPVTQPSLGLLISNGFQYLLSGDYWISMFPGLALVLTIIAINLVADRLRDVLNPQMQLH